MNTVSNGWIVISDSCWFLFFTGWTSNWFSTSSHLCRHPGASRHLRHGGCLPEDRRRSWGLAPLGNPIEIDEKWPFEWGNSPRGGRSILWAGSSQAGFGPQILGQGKRVLQSWNHQRSWDRDSVVWLVLSAYWIFLLIAVYSDVYRNTVGQTTGIERFETWLSCIAYPSCFCVWLVSPCLWSYYSMIIGQLLQFPFFAWFI